MQYKVCLQLLKNKSHFIRESAHWSSCMNSSFVCPTSYWFSIIISPLNSLYYNRMHLVQSLWPIKNKIYFSNLIYIILRFFHKTEIKEWCSWRKLKSWLIRKRLRSFYEQLIERGYVPKREEIEDLADITFEYLLEKCMIDEVFDEEDEWK